MAYVPPQSYKFKLYKESSSIEKANTCVRYTTRALTFINLTFLLSFGQNDSAFIGKSQV